MKRKVLASLLLIAVVAGLVGASTWAYFSDTETSTGNEFTAGTLDMELGGSGGNAIWVSPLNWSPGQTETGTLEMDNVGNVPAKWLRMDATNLIENQGSSSEPETVAENSTPVFDLGKHIIITDMSFYKATENTWYDLTSYYTSVFGVDGVLTLDMLVNPNLYHTWASATSGPVFWSGETVPPDPSPNEQVTLPAGAPDTGDGVLDHWTKIRMGFQFDPDAGNEYQGDWATFELKLSIYNKEATVVYGGAGCGHGYTD